MLILNMFHDIIKDNDLLVQQILNYTDKIEDAAPIFDVEGKRLELLHRELPGNLVRYRQIADELKTLEQFLTLKKDKAEADAYRRFKEGSNRALQPSDIKAYVPGDKDVISWSELMLEVALLRRKAESIVAALETWSWRIGDISRLRIAELQDVIL
ncbi:MAG: hypothetical protein QXN55_01015 [Candidatus Nitrosotenuis sp.]